MNSVPTDGSRTSRTTRFARRGVETGLWTLAAALLVVYCGLRGFGELERRAAIARFLQPISPVASVEAAPLDGSPASGSAIAADVAVDPAGESAAQPAALVAGAAAGAAGGAPLAVLSIASVQLEVPVYADISERNLNRGAGLVPGTAGPGSDGNVAIAAHRDGYFRALQRVALGDIVELATRSERRRYRVAELTIVDPTDLRPLEATDTAAVTLVTCYPFYFVGNAPQRYIVRAVAIP